MAVPILTLRGGQEHVIPQKSVPDAVLLLAGRFGGRNDYVAGPWFSGARPAELRRCQNTPER